MPAPEKGYTCAPRASSHAPSIPRRAAHSGRERACCRDHAQEGNALGQPRRILFGGLALLGLAAIACQVSCRKPFEIHVLGGSTAYGEPYGPDLNAASIASYLLGGEVDGRPVVVVNHGRRGATSSQVLGSLEAVPSDADLVFLYSGHNEFLNIDEPDDLSKLDRQLVDRDPLPADRRRGILERYERNIEAILDRSKERGIPILVSTVASNTAAFDPNRSVLADAGHREAVEALAARAFGSSGAAAEEAWRGILELEPGFAWAHLGLADLLRAREDYAAARRHYVLARDLDALPYRGTSSQNEALRRIAKERGAPLLDTAAAFEAAAPHGLVGYERMWDNCHPTLEGYTIIADLIAREVARMRGLVLPGVDGGEASVARFFGVDDEARFEVLHSRGRFLYSFATLVWAPQERLLRARHYLEQAREIQENAHLLSSLAVVAALQDEPDQSAAFWRRALALDARRTRRRWSDERVQEIMQRSARLRQEADRLGPEIESGSWLPW